MNASHEIKPNLYLVGFMGTGKSAVCRNLAPVLGLEFVDLDLCIEQNAGQSISAIFDEQGEQSFRLMERKFIESGHPDHGCVVSCGGGLIVQPGMVELLKSRGVLVCLFASVDTILGRTMNKKHKRPLLDVEDPAGRIRQLLEEREPFYRQAGAGVSTDNRSISEVTAHVARIYRQALGAS